jgi:hypothetical protein
MGGDGCGGAEQDALVASLKGAVYGIGGFLLCGQVSGVSGEIEGGRGVASNIPCFGCGGVYAASVWCAWTAFEQQTGGLSGTDSTTCVLRERCEGSAAGKSYLNYPGPLLHSERDLNWTPE